MTAGDCLGGIAIAAILVLPAGVSDLLHRVPDSGAEHQVAREEGARADTQRRRELAGRAICRERTGSDNTAAVWTDSGQLVCKTKRGHVIAQRTRSQP